MIPRVSNFLEEISDYQGPKVKNFKKAFILRTDPFNALAVLEDPELLKARLPALLSERRRMVQKLEDYWKQTIEEKTSWLQTANFLNLASLAYLDSNIVFKIVQNMENEEGVQEDFDKYNLPPFDQMIETIGSSYFAVEEERLENWIAQGQLKEEARNSLFLGEAPLFPSSFVFNLYSRMEDISLISNNDGTFLNGLTSDLCILLASTEDGLYLIVVESGKGSQSKYQAELKKEEQTISSFQSKFTYLNYDQKANAYSFLTMIADFERAQELAVLPLLLNFGGTGKNAPFLPLIDFAVLENSTRNDPFSTWLFSLKDRVRRLSSNLFVL